MSDRPNPIHIIALPGALGGPSALRSWFASAAGSIHMPEFRFTAWDLLADVADGASGFDDWADGFAHRAKEISGGTPVVLFGYSLGGRLALHAALHHQDIFAGLIISSAHPGLKDTNARAARRAEDADWAIRARDWPWRDFLDTWEQRPVFASGIPPDQWTSDLASVWKNERESMKTRRAEIARSLEIWSLGAQADLAPLLPNLAIPVLWLNGAEDTRFAELGRQACRSIPRAEHHILPGCGHRIPWENPPACHHLLQDWLARRVNTGG